MIVDLLELTLVIAVGFLFAVAFYESLSSRDVVVARSQRAARRFTSRGWWLAGTYLAAAYVALPLLVVVWALILEVALVLVGSVDLVDRVALLSVAIVGAARMLAYIREKTAHELAKAIPLALLFLLLTGGALRLEEKFIRLGDRDGTELTIEMVLFLVGLEVALRLLTDSSHATLAMARRRRGIEDDAGVWATLWAALRRSNAEEGVADQSVERLG